MDNIEFLLQHVIIPTWDCVRVINLEFCGIVFIVRNSSRQQIQELAHEAKILTSYIRDLKYGTYPALKEGEGEEEEESCYVRDL